MGVRDTFRGITVMGWTAPATASICQDEVVETIICANPGTFNPLSNLVVIGVGGKLRQMTSRVRLRGPAGTMRTMLCSRHGPSCPHGRSQLSASRHATRQSA